MNKVAYAVILFILLGAVLLKCSLSTNFSDPQDRKSFLKAMWLWSKQVGSSTKETAKYAVQEQEWLPNEKIIDEVKESSNKTGEHNESK